MNSWSKLVVSAVVAGFITTNVARANEGETTGHPEDGVSHPAEKASCKGKDGCKGKDSCKGKKHNKKGHKNSCKGKNGCEGKMDGETK